MSSRNDLSSFPFKGCAHCAGHAANFCSLPLQWKTRIMIH
uniref:Uncharacterized protein n=1 Tax=Anguilla anguilla TaxID=7936 RepID=A0A0E9VYQ0_ANGAN